MNFEVSGGSQNAEITITERQACDGILYLDVKMELKQAAVPESFKIKFSFADGNCYSVWNSALRKGERYIGPNWWKNTVNSNLATNMPLHTMLSSNGRNRLTIAVSDAFMPISIGTGVCEETSFIDCAVTFFTNRVAPLSEYAATVRIDTRDVAYYDSIYDTVKWWENDCGYTPTHVPEAAKLPVNSLWYSYHQALDVEKIIEECKLSKPLGMDTVIIDDGWQTDDNNRGYAFCGDWNVAEAKIPSMKQFTDRIHQTGMKVMLWFSVPFMGLYAQNYPKFKDMLLDETGNGRNYWSLDPRYKQVRDFLVKTYADAVRDYGLDGLKLDFIDSFVLRGKSLEYDERRDYRSLEDAVDALMTEITQTLKTINEDILIEFRQTYVGPAIRKYGNMLRVGDCPDDAMSNRQDVINLRLTSGCSAVHSDMIMWNLSESVEVAALQFVSILYSVPQISMRLAELPDEHLKMLKFYLSFWREHRDTLLGGKLLAANPESGYSLVCAEKDGKAIFTAYTDSLIDCEKYDEIIAVNGTRHNALIFKNAKNKSYVVKNCKGEEIAKGEITAELFEIQVPCSGIVFVKQTKEYGHSYHNICVANS